MHPNTPYVIEFLLKIMKRENLNGILISDSNFRKLFVEKTDKKNMEKIIKLIQSEGYDAYAYSKKLTGKKFYLHSLVIYNHTNPMLLNVGIYESIYILNHHPLMPEKSKYAVLEIDHKVFIHCSSDQFGEFGYSKYCRVINFNVKEYETNALKIIVDAEIMQDDKPVNKLFSFDKDLYFNTDFQDPVLILQIKELIKEVYPIQKIIENDEQILFKPYS